jgi:uncharacterized membrane protein YvlD (DUF360 family)
MVMHLKRTIAAFIITAIGVWLLALVLPGFTISNILAAAVLVAMLALFNALLWPLFSKYVMRFMVFTFGVGALILNGIILWLVSLFLSGVQISGWGLLLAPLAVVLVSMLVHGVFSIDDDESYYRSVIKRTKDRTAKGGQPNRTGFIFLEIDGLSETILKKAMENGSLPTLVKWVKEGSHRIKGWETDLSSQTGASQAGILHGCNKDIPAFRWVEKEEGNKVVSSNGIGDAPMIEKRISNGDGLLVSNGDAIANLFTGDSKDNIFVYSRITRIRGLYTESWQGFYSVPYNFAHTVVLFVGDMFREVKSRIDQGRKDVQPRLKHRPLSYYIARAGANVFLREVSTYTVIGDIIAGDKDAVYTTFFGYDEIAHHCGITDDEAFYALKKLDRCISRIDLARSHTKRPYQICVLSDHGQTNGATFKQRYGYSLSDLVQRLLPVGVSVYCELDTNQDHFGQMYKVRLGNDDKRVTEKSKGKDAKEAEAIVLASGNLGLIYFTHWPMRMTLEQINAAYPKMVDGLVNHEGVSFIMVKTENSGPIVIGAKGRFHLSDGKVEGENPLEPFGPGAVQHLRRTDGFNHVPDLLVMSTYDTAKDEVAAFEELIGSHGGLGGQQTKPFILHPNNWDLSEEIIGAEKIYRVFKREMAKAWHQDSSKTTVP